MKERVGLLYIALRADVSSRLSDGRTIHLKTGDTYVNFHNSSLHRPYLKTGVRLLVIGTPFLELDAQKENQNPSEKKYRPACRDLVLYDPVPDLIEIHSPMH
jgi:hypothetical protein